MKTFRVELTTLIAWLELGILAMLWYLLLGSWRASSLARKIMIVVVLLGVSLVFLAKVVSVTSR